MQPGPTGTAVAVKNALQLGRRGVGRGRHFTSGPTHPNPPTLLPIRSSCFAGIKRGSGDLRVTPPIPSLGLGRRSFRLRSPSRGRSVLCAFACLAAGLSYVLVTFPSWDGPDKIEQPVRHTRPMGKGGRGGGWRCVALFFSFRLSDLLCCRALCISHAPPPVCANHHRGHGSKQGTAARASNLQPFDAGEQHCSRPANGPAGGVK